MAFTKQARTLVLVTSGQDRADEIVTLLVDRLPGFALALLDTQTSPQADMAQWLMTQDPPAGFSAERETELKAADKSKAVVRYARHPQDIEEVRKHIEQGQLAHQAGHDLARPSELCANRRLQIKNITLLDAVMDGNSLDYLCHLNGWHPCPRSGALAPASPDSKAEPESIHIARRVSGIKLGLLDEVKQAHERLCQMAQKADGKPPEPFDETAWLRTQNALPCAASRTPLKKQRSFAKSCPSRLVGWRCNSKKSRK